VSELAAGLEQCGIVTPFAATSTAAARTGAGSSPDATATAAAGAPSEAAAAALMALSQQVASVADLSAWASSELVSKPAGRGGSVAAASLAGPTTEVLTGEASLWLAALARATSGLLLQEWAHIRRLDAGGARQLRADLQVRRSTDGEGLECTEAPMRLRSCSSAFLCGISLPLSPAVHRLSAGFTGRLASSRHCHLCRASGHACACAFKAR
jgi:hypothetical protein